MLNTLLTPQIIANESLAILRNNLVMSDLVHRDYSQEFVQVGDTITIRTPASFDTKDFKTSISAQDITEGSVSVTMDRFKDVSVKLTAKQLTLELKDFAEQVIAPVMVSIANTIDADLYNFVFEKAASEVTASSETPTNLKNLADLSKTLDDAKALATDRHLVMSSTHKYRYALTDNLTKVSYAGTNETLREAILGKLFGMRTYMDQNATRSTASTSGTFLGTVTVTGSEDGTTVALADITPTDGTIKAGDGFVYGGRLYRFTSDYTATAGAVASAAISPALFGNIAGSECKVVRGDSSVAFHKNSIAFVTRPLELPLGAARAAVASGEGLSVRVVYGYDQTTKTDTISFDIIYGIAALRPSHAVRLVDTF